MNELTAFEKDFLKQAAIAAMQAMIQARAITEATETRNSIEYRLKGEPQDSGDTLRYETMVDEELFTHSVTCGVGSEINFFDEDNGKYTWGQLIAEEAFDIAHYMLAESRKKRNNLR